MASTPELLFDYLDRLGIAHSTVWHDATFTVDAGRELKATIPGGHSKNLFLKDKDGHLVLVSAHSDSVLKLNQLHKQISTRRLSFGPPDLMEQVLGVVPGSVTPFALMNDPAGTVRFIVDAALMAFDIVNFHPLTNTGTTSISREDLERFVTATGRTLQVMDFTTL